MRKFTKGSGLHVVALTIFVVVSPIYSFAREELTEKEVANLLQERFKFFEEGKLQFNEWEQLTPEAAEGIANDLILSSPRSANGKSKNELASEFLIAAKKFPTMTILEYNKLQQYKFYSVRGKVKSMEMWDGKNALKIDYPNNIVILMPEKDRSFSENNKSIASSHFYISSCIPLASLYFDKFKIIKKENRVFTVIPDQKTDLQNGEISFNENKSIYKIILNFNNYKLSASYTYKNDFKIPYESKIYMNDRIMNFFTKIYFSAKSISIPKVTKNTIGGFKVHDSTFGEPSLHEDISQFEDIGAIHKATKLKLESSEKISEEDQEIEKKQKSSRRNILLAKYLVGFGILGSVILLIRRFLKK